MVQLYHLLQLSGSNAHERGDPEDDPKVGSALTRCRHLLRYESAYRLLPSYATVETKQV